MARCAPESPSPLHPTSLDVELTLDDPACTPLIRVISRTRQVYKFDEGVGDEVTAYVSFGGLLMALTGSYRHISRVTVGEYIYLLIRH